MTGVYLLDGARPAKSIELPQFPDAAWTYTSGAPKAESDILYSQVAAVFRAANLTSWASANIPFALVKGETDVDTSDDWRNVVGFMPEPRELIRLWRLSLFFTNSAYGFMEKVGRSKTLRYIVPSTITPIADNAGLKEFRRTLGATTTTYPAEGGPLFYIFFRDHTTELLPSPNTEMQAAMSAAGIMLYSDYFVSEYFKRGGIRPTMLMVKGMPSREEREKLEGYWDKLIRGFTKYMGKIFNAESVEPKVIGDGVDVLKDSDVYNQAMANVAMATGMPLSLLLANSANYATAQSEYASWFRDSVVPYCNYMAEWMNLQLFVPLGYRFEFRPNQAEPSQQEEVERASAYATYVGAGMLPSVAAQVVGIELPPGVEYDDLDPEEEEAEPEPQSAPETETPEQEAAEEQVEEIEPTTMRAWTPTPSEYRKLEIWRRWANKAQRAGEPLTFTFDAAPVPAWVTEIYRERLQECKSLDDIAAAFDRPVEEADELADIKALADAINRAAAAVK